MRATKVNLEKNPLLFSFLAMALALGIALGSSQSSAYSEDYFSGGVPGVFCPRSVPGQPKVQVYDIFEARENEGLLIRETPESMENQIKRAEAKLGFDRVLKTEFYFNLLAIRASAKFLRAGVSIKDPNSIGAEPIFIPTGCTLDSIAFHEQDKFLISKDSYELLSNTQKAAFWIHAAIHRTGQHFKYYQAKQTRALVAQLLASDLSQDQLEQAALKFSRKQYYLDHRYSYGLLSDLSPKSQKFVGLKNAWTYIYGNVVPKFRVKYEVLEGERWDAPLLSCPPLYFPFEQWKNHEVTFDLPAGCEGIEFRNSSIHGSLRARFEIYDHDTLLIQEEFSVSGHWRFGIFPFLR